MGSSAQSHLGTTKDLSRRRINNAWTHEDTQPGGCSGDTHHLHGHRSHRPDIQSWARSWRGPAGPRVLASKASRGCAEGHGSQRRRRNPAGEGGWEGFPEGGRM